MMMTTKTTRGRKGRRSPARMMDPSREFSANTAPYEKAVSDAIRMPIPKGADHIPDPTIYRKWGRPQNGKYVWTAPHDGRKYRIAYTLMGDQGPVVLFLHGVPTNRSQWFPIQRLCAPFCRTISIDMLGMGESSQPTDYTTQEEGNWPRWDWIYDVEYIDALMRELFGDDEPFVFVADDWGGGILLAYAQVHSDRLLAQIYSDPVAFDGYPVTEIQAIGRAAGLPEAEFKAAFADFDSKMAQILKTMVVDSSRWNQWSLRHILEPYVEQDYGAPGAGSLTLNLRYDHIRVLAQRASRLRPDQNLQYDMDTNPDGVHYDLIKVPHTLVMWGAQDNMMPPNQIYYFVHMMRNSRVTVQKIESAGHFAMVDQPHGASEMILNYLIAQFGPGFLADVFVGYTGVWKGTEREYVETLRML